MYNFDSANPSVWILKNQNTGDTNNRMAIARRFRRTAAQSSFQPPKASSMSSCRNLASARSQNPKAGPTYSSPANRQPTIMQPNSNVLAVARPSSLGCRTPSSDTNSFNSSPYRDCLDMQILFHHHDSAVSGSHNDTRIVLGLYNIVPTCVTASTLRAAKLGMKIQSVAEGRNICTMAIGSILHTEALPDELKAAESALIADNLRALMKKVRQALDENRDCILVTTSRRTGREFIPVISAALAGFPHYVHDWAATDENPYLAMLAAASRIVVTGDSISMVSDALATGKAVHVYAPSVIPGEAADLSLHRQFLETPLLRKEVKLYMSKLAQNGFIHAPSASQLQKNIPTSQFNSAATSPGTF
jgi:hypothetical protein